MARYDLIPSDVAIQTSISNSTPKPGETISVNLTFQSNVYQELKIYAIGVHTEWMPAEQFLGPNLSSNPITVASKGQYDTQFSFQIPSSTALGLHTYTVRVEGLDSFGGTFSFNSAEKTLQVISTSTIITPSPSMNPAEPTSNPTQSTSPTPYTSDDSSTEPTPSDSTQDASPTPTVPEFSWVTMLSCLMIVLLVTITVTILRKQKSNSSYDV